MEVMDVNLPFATQPLSNANHLRGGITSTLCRIVNIKPNTIAITIGAITPFGYLAAFGLDGSLTFFFVISIMSGFSIAKGMIDEPAKTTLKAIKFKTAPIMIILISFIAFVKTSRVPWILLWSLIFITLQLVFVHVFANRERANCSIDNKH